MPYDATLSDSLTITSFFYLAALLSYEPLTDTCAILVGCSCPHLPFTRFTTGEETKASEEATGEEGCCGGLHLVHYCDLYDMHSYVLA